MKQTNNFKQTEIGEIPEDWKLSTLGELADITSSKRIFASEYQTEGVPFFRGKEVIEKNAGNDVSTELFVSEEKYSEIKEKFGVPQINDILLTSVGTLGVPYRVMDDDKFYFKDGNITWFKNLDDTTSEFLFHWLNSDFGKRRLIEKSIGSTQQALTIEALKSIEIALPSITERQQIASVLSSLDDKIELNRRMNKTLEEIGKALFDQLNEVEDSSAIELTEIVDFNPRESLSKSTEARYLEMKDLPEQGMWIASNIKKPYKGGSKFRNGDILMARITPCLENGKSGFVNSLDDGELAFGSTEFIVLRPKKRMFAEYIYYLVRNELFRRHATRSMVGSSGRQRVQVDVLKSYKLSFPKDDKLEEFNKSANTLFEQIKQNSVEIELLSQIRDKLLPRLMSGKIRVTV